MTSTEPAAISVSQLTSQLKGVLEGRFPSVWVAGEISNFAHPASGHMYFTLKDAKSQIKAALFRGINMRMKFSPRDGLEVLARGRVSVFDQRGEYQLIIEELQPKGVGAAELALRQLKEKLLARGFFDPRRKRRLPRFPKRVALVASATGAAVRDMIELLAQRWPVADVIVRHSRVQGDTAAEEIAAAIRQLNVLHLGGSLPLDAIVLGRGGGSTEDLWAFNELPVAEAVFASAVPVVSAVGHEIDVTIADLVADHRAETPSAAVVALTPDARELLPGLDEWRVRLREAVLRNVEQLRKRVDQLASRPALRRPLQRVQELEQRLDDTAARLHRAAKARVASATEKVAALAAQLETLSPLGVLARGYSLTHANGKLVRHPDDVQTGDVLTTRVAGGTVISRAY
jgi:exodeoxyribonuclease VII large subunit